MSGQLTELARQGQLLLLGDDRGDTHLVQVVGQGMQPGLLPEAIDVPSVRAIPIITGGGEWRSVGHHIGVHVTVAFADGMWFRLRPIGTPGVIDLTAERRRRTVARTCGQEPTCRQCREQAAA